MWYILLCELNVAHTVTFNLKQVHVVKYKIKVAFTVTCNLNEAHIVR